MECHRCPDREKIENGEFAQVAYSNTPCAKCQLNENSDLTMEFHVEMADAANCAPQTNDNRPHTEEETLPISVMKEIVFRLLSMTPENRDVLCWRFAGIPYRDIAVLQGVTVAAVEKRHWKAMKKWPALRAMFATKVAKHGQRRSVDKKPVGGKEKINGKRVAFEKRNG